MVPHRGKNVLWYSNIIPVATKEERMVEKLYVFVLATFEGLEKCLKYDTFTFGMAKEF